ncbi:hypothetical protein PI124_g21511 [Phytophthora idaei]|nr:hypothetical protein PI125_g23887 [Phytophthora idaei]KAG3133826.1 hypothetical protein PI126_g18992 [Phytophthora idaei]KAG3233415.1 hypothetical protein PI124_g21511 [Phytophthora idaei]
MRQTDIVLAENQFELAVILNRVPHGTPASWCATVDQAPPSRVPHEQDNTQLRGSVAFWTGTWANEPCKGTQKEDKFGRKQVFAIKNINLFPPKFVLIQDGPFLKLII